MTKAVVLGTGMVGQVMAADLASDPGFSVTATDFSPDNLANVERRCGRSVKTIKADLSDPITLRRIIADADIVLGALSSRIAFSALKTILEAGKNFCDISFMAEDPLELDSLAKKHNVTAIVDCGVAPGMSHLLAGYAAANLSPCDNIEIYVGGLPRERRWPYEYKAAFSPADVIEEYTRPSRLVEHGKVVTREALSEPELMNFPGAGTLEAFNTDGLRSLVKTLNVPFMKEKTLRYPGHIELMRVLRETGYFTEDPIKVGNTEVRPRDLTAKLLFPKWTYEPGEEDLTVMRVLGDGIKNGKRQRMQWDLFDLYHRESQSTSMARTTAFPCVIMAKMIAAGKLKKPGVFTPELLATEPNLLNHILAEHAARGVKYEFRTAPALLTHISMSPLASAILITWRRNATYSLRLVGDLSDTQFTAQPIPGRTLNHPAWVLSHLTLYTTISAAMLRNNSFPDPADHIYGAKSEPLPDPSAYPARAILVEQFKSAHDDAEAAILAARDETFASPTPLERWRTLHPSTGDMLVTLMVKHESAHLGQLSAWRRAMGQPRVAM